MIARIWEHIEVALKPTAIRIVLALFLLGTIYVYNVLAWGGAEGTPKPALYELLRLVWFLHPVGFVLQLPVVGCLLLLRNAGVPLDPLPPWAFDVVYYVMSTVVAYLAACIIANGFGKLSEVAASGDE